MHFQSRKLIWQSNLKNPRGDRDVIYLPITRGLCSHNARLFSDDVTAIGRSYWCKRQFHNYTRLHRSRMEDLYHLTRCGLLTPYGGKDLGQHWFRWWLVAWRPRAITWTNVDLSSLRSSDIKLRAILLELSQPSVTKISLKIISLIFYWNLPRANEFGKCIGLN